MHRYDRKWSYPTSYTSTNGKTFLWILEKCDQLFEENILMHVMEDAVLILSYPKGTKGHDDIKLSKIEIL